MPNGWGDMQQYLDLLSHILNHGASKDDRTKTGTLSVFGYQMRFELERGFPLLTTKRLHVRSIFHELLWFLRGDTHIGYLHDHNVTIWDEWADADGELGPIYGHQWRAWPDRAGGGIDQLAAVVERIKLIGRDPGLVRASIVAAQNAQKDLGP